MIPEDCHPDAMFHRTQDRQATLRAHRRSLGGETPAQRAQRQRHRAEALTHTLSAGHPRHSPALLRAMLALVVADEAPDPPGDLPEPTPPGARAVLKPTKKSTRKSHPTKDQEALF